MVLKGAVPTNLSLRNVVQKNAQKLVQISLNIFKHRVTNGKLPVVYRSCRKKPKILKKRVIKESSLYQS